MLTFEASEDLGYEEPVLEKIGGAFDSTSSFRENMNEALSNFKDEASVDRKLEWGAHLNASARPSTYYRSYYNYPA